MEITAGVVKQLREKTGVGMMECKSALVEAKGDLSEAEKILRKKGLAAAANKAGRATGEGIIATAASADAAVLIELNCETDFAARGADFQGLVKAAVDTALAKGAPTEGSAPTDAAREALLDAPSSSGRPLRQTIGEAVGKIGENMQLRRYVKFQKSAPGSVLASYIHTGGKIGVLVEAESASGPVGEALLRDLAMHIAAAAPRYVTRDEVSPKVLADEQEIARDQALKAGKPAQVVEKIVAGRIDKFLGEVTLVEQAFVKDPDKTVKQLLGDGVRVRRFARFVLGEGL
ncbi:MAG TPA: translation elongation factor Ts [Candidatus Polarisedimenticolaceae bacterium]|nr:translation elongation factor Ts [Candidatus Polarisedimenticolaceae bacterium]